MFVPHSGKVILLLTVLLWSTTVTAAPAAYTLGIVPQYDSGKLEAIWRPIIERVEKRAGIKIDLMGAPDIPAFEKQFVAGVFDIAYMNPYHVLVSNQAQGYVPIVRDIERKLYGILVVKKDSALQNIKQLENKVIAFPAPNALGASMLLRAKMARKFNMQIKPKYVNSHDSVYLNVALGQADAGGGVQKTLEQQSPEVRRSLRVIYKTKKFPSHPVVVHPRVKKEVSIAIRDAFMEIGMTPDGRKLLQKIPIQKIGHADIGDYKELEALNLGEFYNQRH